MFDDFTDHDVREGYFAAVEHFKDVRNAWWRAYRERYGIKYGVEFDPSEHYIPKSAIDEREGRMLRAILRAEKELADITAEFDDRDIAGQRLQERRENELEEDYWDQDYLRSTGRYPRSVWSRKVCVLCRECGHEGTIHVTNLALLQFTDWLDRLAPRVRCTHCGVLGYVDAMTV